MMKLQYSFGILMWEVFTRGQLPFARYKKWPADMMLRPDGDLPRPNCHDHIYDLMRRCWHESIDSRPTMQEVYYWKSHTFLHKNGTLVGAPQAAPIRRRAP